jgi:hypothetical protein
VITELRRDCAPGRDGAKGCSPKARLGYCVEMAFIRAQDEVFESVEGIHFLMRDQHARKNVACVVAREALTARGSIHDPPLSAMQAFETCRAEIERIASDRWERGEADHRGIIRVTSAHFR